MDLVENAVICERVHVCMCMSSNKLYDTNSGGKNFTSHAFTHSFVSRLPALLTRSFTMFAKFLPPELDVIQFVTTCTEKPYVLFFQSITQLLYLCIV